MADTTERDEKIRQRWIESMEGDFNPGNRPESTATIDYRMANAAEYSAYQLGKINRNLAKLIEVLEKRNVDGGDF
jgi:hypothetical protein